MGLFAAPLDRLNLDLPQDLCMGAPSACSTLPPGLPMAGNLLIL